MLSVLTPENLEVTYRVAGLGTRALAWLIDALVLAVVLSLLQQIFNMMAFGQKFDIWLQAILASLAFVIINCYFIFCEHKMGGQTPGKRAMNLRVIRSGGYPLRFSDSLVRNLLRNVDWLPALYGAGTLCMLLTHENRRLGDLAAGTYVIKEEPPLPAANDVPAPRDRYPEVVRLRGEEIDLVRLFFQRLPFLDHRHRADLGYRLAEYLAGRLEMRVPPDRSSEGYLIDLLHSSGS
ncbi:MAG: RDD family protein [Candidatus Xenobia bacterium]